MGVWVRGECAKRVGRRRPRRAESHRECAKRATASRRAADDGKEPEGACKTAGLREPRRYISRRGAGAQRLFPIDRLKQPRSKFAVYRNRRFDQISFSVILCASAPLREFPLFFSHGQIGTDLLSISSRHGERAGREPGPLRFVDGHV